MWINDDGYVGIGSSSPSVSLDVRTTDAVKLPAGTSAQRSASPLAGATRFNSDLRILEYFDGTSWISVTPAGTIIAFGGTSIPNGWLVCNGSTISRTAYAPLFNAISTSWGNGDGSSTFNLPDLRGRFRAELMAVQGETPIMWQELLMPCAEIQGII